MNRQLNKYEFPIDGVRIKGKIAITNLNAIQKLGCRLFKIIPIKLFHLEVSFRINEAHPIKPGSVVMFNHNHMYLNQSVVDFYCTRVNPDGTIYAKTTIPLTDFNTKATSVFILGSVCSE